MCCNQRRNMFFHTLVLKNPKITSKPTRCPVRLDQHHILDVAQDIESHTATDMFDTNTNEGSSSNDDESNTTDSGSVDSPFTPEPEGTPKDSTPKITNNSPPILRSTQPVIVAAALFFGWHTITF